MSVSESANGPRFWHRLRISVPAATGEDFSAQCFELGSCGVQHEEHAGGMWLFTVYFESATQIGRVRSELALFLERTGEHSAARFETATEVERDWSTAWRDFLQPVQVTDRIRVTQPWNVLHAPEEDRFEIVIEPKMAFGSGGHESTRLCLMALDGSGSEGASCLDVGAGSGVLSIAATLLGACRVTAIDCDPVATDNARENVALNLGGSANLHERVQVVDGSVEVVEGRQYDLIMANIESQHLYPLLEPIEKLLAADGVAIFSGLMTREADCFRQWLEAVGLRGVDERELNGWICLTTERV